MDRFRTWFWLAWMVLAAVAPARALQKEDVRAHTLDNGLRVLLLPDPAIPNVAMYTFFRVGSRNERSGLTGVSHFIEHMMFNGTTAVGPGEFDRRMETFGGSNNASTSEDVTIYMDWFPAGNLEAMVVMEADRIQGLAFDPKVLESERGVVASERRLVVDNNNEGILRENIRATAIMAHPYHWDVIGWMSDIQSWRRDDILQYYRTYYAPNNAVLVVVGDFDADRALELITQHYGPIPAGPAAPAVTTVEPPQLGAKRVSLRREALTPSFSMVYHVPGCADPDFAPLEILEKILLEGESARLHRRLVRQERLATEVSGGVQTSLDPYLFEISVKPVADADVARIETVVREELDKLRTGGVSDRELQKACNQIRSDFYFGLETIADRALQLGLAEVFYGGYERLFNRMDRYAGVTLDDIRRVAGKYFTAGNVTVGTLLPEKPTS